MRNTTSAPSRNSRRWRELGEARDFAESRAAGIACRGRHVVSRPQSALPSSMLPPAASMAARAPLVTRGTLEASTLRLSSPDRITFARSLRRHHARRLSAARSILGLRLPVVQAHFGRVFVHGELKPTSAGGAAAASGRLRNRPCGSRPARAAGPCGRGRRSCPVRRLPRPTRGASACCPPPASIVLRRMSTSSDLLDREHVRSRLTMPRFSGVSFTLTVCRGCAAGPARARKPRALQPAVRLLHQRHLDLLAVVLFMRLSPGSLRPSCRASPRSVRRAHAAQRVDGRAHDVDRVARAVALGQHVLHAGALRTPRAWRRRR